MAEQGLGQVREFVKKIYGTIEHKSVEEMAQEIRVLDCNIHGDECGKNRVCYDCEVYRFAYGKKSQ